MKQAAELAPIEALDRNIVTLCTHINAATYELLVLIREFDERAGWLQWGLKNCAEWLAWRCDCRSGPWPRTSVPLDGSVAAAVRPLEISTLTEVAALCPLGAKGRSYKYGR